MSRLIIKSLACYDDYSDIFKDFKYNKNFNQIKYFEKILNNNHLFFEENVNYFLLPVNNSFHVDNLVKLLARYYKIPYLYVFTLTRIVQKQATLNRHQRIKNLENAMIINQGLPKDCHFILFDDVYTSGATLRAMYQCLLDENVSKNNITAITFFRPKLRLA